MSHSNTTVTVTGLSSTTTAENLEKFLGFCGKVTDLQFNPEAHSATVTFAKESSARTAEFLNGGSLDGATLAIVGPSHHEAGEKRKSLDEEPHREGEEIGQEHKPRSAIAAEYLAHGYTLGDSVIQQSISLDQKYGISTRFLSYWQTLNDHYQTKVAPHVATAHATVQPHVETATGHARSLDEKGGISSKVGGVVGMGREYYRSAMASPQAQAITAFYTNGAKSVWDVHEEARRIAESKKASGAHPAAAAPATGGGAAVTTDAAATTEAAAAPAQPGV